MDANGARLLADRIRTGVSVGMRIELVVDLGDDSGLRAGDRGFVSAIDQDGRIVVEWDRGITAGIDPRTTSFHKLAA